MSPDELLRVVVMDDYQEVAASIADWASVEPIELRTLTTHISDEDELVDHVREAEIVVAMRERTALPRHVIARLPNLRLIVTTGTRNASIDVAAAREQGIEICGTRFSPADTAELTWALILAGQRNLVTEIDHLRAGGWQRGLGSTLSGKRMGIVGLGRLGVRVARVAQAFGMDVVAWSQNLTAEAALDAGARRVDKRELFATSDVISLHLVLSQRTRNIVAAEDLSRTKPGALLVNTARAGLVDQAALLDALQRGVLARAALDVFEQEPLPRTHPFRSMDQVLMTPHIGYVTHENYRIFFDDIVEDIRRFRSGDPVRIVQEAPR